MLKFSEEFNHRKYFINSYKCLGISFNCMSKIYFSVYKTEKLTDQCNISHLKYNILKALYHLHLTERISDLTVNIRKFMNSDMGAFY